MRLVYLSPVTWASFAQRPHKFVEWFHARSGDEVLWLDPYPTRLPVLADLRSSRPRQHALQDEIPEWLTVLQPPALPIEPLPASGKINRLFWKACFTAISAFASLGEFSIGIGKPSELALQVLRRFPDTVSFYDAMDDFPAFYSGISRSAMERRERMLAGEVGKILVSSSELYRRFIDFENKLVFVPNACAQNSLPPIESCGRWPERPVLGYVGTIGHWFDWELLTEIACQNPAATIRLIGPIHSSPLGLLPDNVECLPACSHAEAIEAMLGFSVGLIPFKQNDLTASVDPIKYYEYRSLGLPVISSSFGEMASRGEEIGVFLADEQADLQGLVRSALACHVDIAQIQAFRAGNTWEARFNASGIFWQ